MAQWIWNKRDNKPNQWVCFGKTFELGTSHDEVIAHIAVDSKYWLWVNGKMAVREGGLKRGPNAKDTYCDKVDLSNYMQVGQNHIAILVWFWGISSSSHLSSGKPGLYFRLDMPEGAIESNHTWKTRDHCAFKESAIRKFNDQYILSEWDIHFDAMLDLDLWQVCGFHGAEWENAVEFGEPPCIPWNRLVERPIPFWKDSSLQDFLQISQRPLEIQAEKYEILALLPANLQVYPYFKVLAHGGEKITVQIERDWKTTEYICKEGVQEFEIPVWGNGHYIRYIIPKGVEVADLKYRETGYDTVFIRGFHSDDDALNKLWEKSVRSTYLNMRDTYMDCPDRERSQWPADASNMIEQALYVFDRNADFLTRKFFNELIGWRTSEGILWGAVPTGRFQDSYREFPAQTLAAIGVGLKQYFLKTQDRALVAGIFPHISKYLLELWRVDPEELVEHRGPWELQWGNGVQSWYDWGENQDWRLLDNTWYYIALTSLELCAHEIGGELGQKVLRETQRRMCLIRDSFDRIFWDGEAFRSPGIQRPADERGNALAVYAGLAGEDKWPYLRTLFKNNRFSGIYMEKYVIEALCIMGFIEDAVERMKTRFAKEIASDYTTLPEHFGEDSNHGYGGWPIVILCKYIQGLQMERKDS